MNLADTFFGMFAATRTYDGTNPRDPVLAKLFGGGSQTSAKIAVTPDKVLSLPPVKRAVEILANGMMNKVCKVVQVRERGDVQDRTHPANSVLKRANDAMLFGDWIHVMMIWAILRGNAVSSIEVTEDGRYQLVPFLPDRTMLVMVDDPDMQKEIGSILYRTTIKGQHIYRLPQNVIHIQGLSTNGYWGYDLVTLFKETFGGSIGARDHGNRVWGQGASPKGFVRLKNTLADEEARQRFVDSIRSLTGGLGNSHRIALLEEGAEFQPLEQTNEETQFLGKLEFDNTDLANLMGIQPAKIGVRKEQSYNSLEMADVEHQKDDLQAWQTKFENEMSAKLLEPGQFENETHRIVFEQRISTVPFKERAESAQKLYTSSIYDRNQALKLLGNPPVSDAENDRIRPLNTQDVQQIDIDQQRRDNASVELAKQRLAAAAEATLAGIITRLDRAAQAKLKKGTAEFMEWADALDVKQGDDWIHASSVPMCEQIKAGLNELLATPGSKITAEQLSGKFGEFAELPSQFANAITETVQ